MEYYDYKHLHAIGMIGLGIPLEELVSGAPHTQQEIAREFGMIYSFKHTLFDLIMDTPLQQPLIKELLKEAGKAQGVSYVSTVTYGKVGLLVIESDIDSRRIKLIVDKIVEDASLSADEIRLLESADFSYVYFSNDGEAQVMNGGMEIIEAYKNGMKDTTENIYPMEFSLADFTTHVNNEIHFTVKIPD